ncbi:DUF3876 domain-containing protein [Limibacterium fermenti]|uniref:DUF3876 domain-containing protein n=1 Tax=Limibacterium fermenti TaxID=3229863 RepID=UPI003A685C99
MFSKSISNEKLGQITLHLSGITDILMELFVPEDQKAKAFEPILDEDLEPLVIQPLETGVTFEELSRQAATEDYGITERLQREQALSRLCGRWTPGNNRCGVEISRRGEHFILTYLKRNGCATDERYVLIWLDGDILYYGHEDRITVLAYNTGNDTLMLSPGADYTRMPEEKR